MKRWKQCKMRVLAFLLVTVNVIAGTTPVYAKRYWPKGPEIHSESAVVVEVNTGTILYEKAPDEKHYPASITKVLTTLLTLENCDLDEIVTFSEEAVYKNEGSTSNIARDLNEQMTVEQCLYAVMLESANECAYQVAEYTGEKLGGDYRTFIDLMNQRAKEIGCTNTHFNNSNGLPDEEHWTSAHDMALIAAEAYRNDNFRAITGSESYTIPATNKHSDPTPCHNHHKMIYPWQGDSRFLWDYVTGGKTGYTNAARNTLVTFAEKDGLTLACVVMCAETPNHYTDTRSLLDYCFDNFHTFNILENETSLSTDVSKPMGMLNDNPSFVTLDNNAYIILPKSATFEDAELERVDAADNSDSQALAEFVYTYGGKKVGDVRVVRSKVKNAKVDFKETVAAIKEEHKDADVVTIRPIYVLSGILAVAVLFLLIFLVKKFYDNYYVMRHNREVRREQKARFRSVGTKKKYRKRDRLFK